MACLPPESLPPSDAAKYHSDRVYHQVQTWLGHTLDPTQWVWLVLKGKEENLKPVRMVKDATPTSLLKLVDATAMASATKTPAPVTIIDCSAPLDVVSAKESHAPMLE